MDPSPDLPCVAEPALPFQPHSCWARWGGSTGSQPFQPGIAVTATAGGEGSDEPHHLVITRGSGGCELTPLLYPIVRVQGRGLQGSVLPAKLEEARGAALPAAQPRAAGERDGTVPTPRAGGAPGRGSRSGAAANQHQGPAPRDTPRRPLQGGGRGLEGRPRRPVRDRRFGTATNRLRGWPFRCSQPSCGRGQSARGWAGR